jgi:hypothetical protein
MIFLVDNIILNKAYPNLGKWAAQPYTQSWREFDQHWPFVTPVRLFEYFDEYRISYDVQKIGETIPANSCYPIALSFFNFEIDYFALLPAIIKTACASQACKILFYYHEGDNPINIKHRIEALCSIHNLPSDCYIFISGNTVARDLDNFLYFPDHEFIYQLRNKHHAPGEINFNTRPYQFVALNRTHKWWRATIMADLHRANLLDYALWSYQTELSTNDNFDNNPIEVDTLNIRDYVDNFYDNAPYWADNFTLEQQNDHSKLVRQHYDDAYFHLVIETHFDADGSGGAFLTEKIFKPIKHGQPFVVAGTPRTLATLRDLGYRVFDSQIDNSYDLELNNTARWIKLRDTIAELTSKNMHNWFLSCIDDVKHNQELYNRPKLTRLNKIIKDIHELTY